MKIEVLCENPWLELRKMVDPDNGVQGYIYSHEKRCNGKILSILPYSIELDGSMQFLLRKEVTPCWSMDPIVSSITGGYEGKDMIEDVIRELKEEAGYDAIPSEIISLGTCRGTKSTDTVFHIYSIDLTGKPKSRAVGDGSELEAKAHCFWSKTINEAEDPLVYVSYTRLMDKVKHSFLYVKALENMKNFVKGQADLDPNFGKIINERFSDLL
jgi:8-oxo-dGTP pyrophosphatase MutT (NUDIX family)